MYIRMEFIQKELKEEITCSHLVNSPQLLAFKMWEASITALDETILYLCDIAAFTDILPELIQGTCQNFFIFGNHDTIPSCLNHCNYLFCKADYSDFILYINKLGNIFHKYNAWEQKLIQHLTLGHSLQNMINTGYEMLEMPLVIMDANHQPIACIDVPYTDDPLYSCIQSGYGHSFMDMICKCNPTLEEVEQEGCIDTINSVSNRRIIVSRLKSQSHISRYIGMHKQDHDPFDAADLLLFHFLAGYLEKAEEMSFQSAPTDIYSNFLEDLILSPEPAISILSRNNSDRSLSKEPFRLLCIQFTNHLRFRTTYHNEIARKIRRLIPDCHSALIQSHIAILITGKTNLKKYSEKLTQILAAHDAICACSCIYYNLSDTKKVWHQLDFILNHCKKNDPQKIYHYENFRDRQCIDMIRKHFPAESMYHSALYKIYAFDQTNHTDYLQTLIDYIQNNCSINATTSLLKIHRNSLLYRIHKIEEILGFEISSSEERPFMLFSSLFISNRFS